MGRCTGSHLPGTMNGTTYGARALLRYGLKTMEPSVSSPSSADVGVNPWTSYCQIVADELGVPVEDVTVKPFDSDQIFSLMSPDGSCNLCSNGFIVRKAAQKARALLLDLALNSFEGLTVEDLDIRDRFVFERKILETRSRSRILLSGHAHAQRRGNLDRTPHRWLGLAQPWYMGRCHGNRKTPVVQAGSLHGGGGGYRDR